MRRNKRNACQALLKGNTTDFAAGRYRRTTAVIRYREFIQVSPARTIKGQSAALDSPLTLLFEVLKSFNFFNLENDCGIDPVRALLAKDSTSSACAVESWIGSVGGGQRKET